MLVHEIINNGRDEDIAIVDEGRQITYAQFKQGIRRYRNRLHELGIRRGDRVGIFSRNSEEFIYAYFATASLGAINVPINFQLSSRETAYILKNAGVEHLLTYEPIQFDEELSVTISRPLATKILPTRPTCPPTSATTIPASSFTPPARPAIPKARCSLIKILCTTPANAASSNAAAIVKSSASCRCITASAGRAPCSTHFIAAQNCTSCACSSLKT